MQYVLKKIGLLSLLVLLWAVKSFASGFYIPNQSSDAIAVSGAHVASPSGADSSFYNPANMAWQRKNARFEGGVTTLVLPSINYVDSRTPLFHGDSKTETFVVPHLFMVSAEHNKLRFGFSLTSPFGLSKRWQQPFPRASSEEFSLTVIEGNPVVSYRISDMVSVGGGVRFIYADATAISLATNPPLTSMGAITILSRDLNGDTLEAGYNLALSVRPNNNLLLAATYRSEVDLGLEGDARLKAMAGAVTVDSYNGGANVEATTPALYSMAAAYTFSKLTAEFVWERVLWSCFEQLDFQYEQSLLGTAFDSFDRPLPKNWSDTDTFKFGITYQWNDRLKTAFGLSVDESPVPDSTLGFELPDSNAISYSGGLNYQLTEQVGISLAYLYHHSKSRAVTNLDASGNTNISGVFSDGGAHLINTSVSYEF